MARRLCGPVLRPINLNLPRINETGRNEEGFIVNREISFSLTEPRFLVEIPTNTDEMRVHALKLARQWRLETRRIFLRAFESGCRVLDFVTTGVGSERRAFYLLRRTRSGRPT
jgi:predicted GNAT superfamily acetyltransferase